MPPTPPRLEIKNITRSYDGRRVVDDVSLSVRAGQVTCLLGPSGCGKSTTLRIIAGVEMQDSGEIYVDGALICDTRFRIPPEQRNIGLMFQDFALFPHLTVGDNVRFGLPGDRGRTAGRVRELLDRVGLGQYAKSYPHELSGGEQQRVALARAAAPRPRILLADEPTGNLDGANGQAIIDMLFGMRDRHGATLVLVTHAPELAARCDRELRLRDGRLLGAVMQDAAQ